MTKFTKSIKEIQDSNDFFEIDYSDILQNFDINNETEDKVPLSMQLSLINVAFLDSIRGPISRPKFIDKLLTLYRREWIEDIRYRTNDNKDNKENIE
jgi:hypothetical protein